MKKLITFETLSNFAATTADAVKLPIRGIVLNFTGLGFGSMLSSLDDYTMDLAERGILRVIPYYNPWCWMNRQTVDYVDEIVDVRNIWQIGDGNFFFGKKTCAQNLHRFILRSLRFYASVQFIAANNFEFSHDVF